MSNTNKRWSHYMVARNLISLVDQHGAPNRFQLHELAGDSNRKAILEISRIARLQSWQVNMILAGSGLQANYEVRKGTSCPAYIFVTSNHRAQRQ